MGQTLGALMGTDNYELEATLPLRDLKYVKVGNSVVLHSDDMDGQWQGRIKRISDQVEPGTQTVKLFIGVSGKGLRENMYLRGEVAGSPVAEAFELPRQLLVEQKSVYVFQDSLLRLQEVEVVRIKENTAIIRGLSAGTPLLAQPFPDAFDGRAVFINRPSPKGKAQSADSADEASLGQLK
jgi:membrane fusion protein, multidrug efflux system